LEARLLQPARRDPSALQQQLRFRAQQKRASRQHPPRRRQPELHASRLAKLAHELAIWDRAGGGEVDRSVKLLVPDEEIQRAKDRPLTSIYWNVVVTPILEGMTKEYSLDATQQASLRSLLTLRRSKFIALLDSTPHPSIRLSRLAPLIERMAPPAK